MNKIIALLVTLVAIINTVQSSESENKFIADLMKPFRGLNYRRTDRSRDDNTEIAEAVENIETNNEPASLPNEESAIVEAVKNKVTNNEPAASSPDKKKISGRVPVFNAGNFPVDEYPNADLVVYAPNVDFPEFDLYEIDAVTDAIQCGSQFCAGDIKCTHFVFRKSDNHCWLKSNYATGSKWGISKQEMISGLIPFRACDITKATVPSLLSCLSLGGL